MSTIDDDASSQNQTFSISYSTHTTMPRLDDDGQEELQALVAIRQTLEPLITKRILDDTDKITSLAVSNSRDLFKFELGQILLNLKKEQDLQPEDYASFLDDLHRLLQLLEGLVDEEVLRPSVDPDPVEHQDNIPAQPQAKSTSTVAVDGLASLIYPKLAALMKAASDDRDPSNLSKFLRLPEREEDCKEAEQTLTDFNAKNLSRSNTAGRDDLGGINVGNRSRHKPATKSKSRSHRLESIRQSQECLSGILNALTNNIQDSKCPDCHIAKLQIRDPGNNSSNDGLQYKLFVTCSTVQDKWQETTCTVVRNLPSNLKVKIVPKICKDIQRALEDYQVLKILVHSSRILRFPKSDIERTKSPPVWPTVSLGSIIANGEDRFKPLDKVILAMNLSRAFLRMYSSEMQSKEWNAENIFFLFNPAERTICEAYNPYFAYSLLQIQRCADDEPDRPRKFAVLISFAKLLLEIALEKPLGPFSAPRDIALLELIDESEAADSVVKGYLDAVAACLEANKRRKDDDSYFDNEDEIDSDNDSMDEETQCRTVILTAVTNLEDARQNNFRSRKSSNFPKVLKVSDDVQSQSISKTGNIAAPVNSNSSSTKVIPTNEAIQAGMAITTISQDKYNPGSPNQLFDVRKMVFNPGDERIFRAKNFLSRAENFYTNHIHNLSNDRKIRIAILDTGINEYHAFFKGVKATRRARDSPFKGMQSFTGDSNAADSFGHGTNVASLILQIAREANLYVAKISEGQEEEGPEPIVKAIQWATSPDVNADIISMSFAFLNDQPTIKEAIKNAEKKGVVFFAAASNYGGNTPRLFPAKLHDKVLCIHASDGDGNKSGMDPTPKPFSESLSTLGVAVPSIFEPGVFVSGTSYSTPIMVGIAANILRFVQHVTNKGLLTEEQRIEAFTRMGVRNILLAMSEERDLYNYVTPWRKMWNVGADVGDVVSKIKEALKE